MSTTTATTSTTIRVDPETQVALHRLAAETGASLADTARAAVDALHRQLVAQRLTAELDALRAEHAHSTDDLVGGGRAPAPARAA